jgi:hypothetical protein
MPQRDLAAAEAQHDKKGGILAVKSAAVTMVGG